MMVIMVVVVVMVMIVMMVVVVMVSALFDLQVDWLASRQVDSYFVLISGPKACRKMVLVNNFNNIY